MSTREKKFVKVNATADGDNTVIAAVAGRQIRVVGYCISALAAGTITFQDDTASAVVIGALKIADAAIVSYAGSEDAPAFEGGNGKGIEINTSAGLDITGHLTYVLI